MPGTILTAFADMVESITPAYTQMGPKHLFNAAGKNTYLWPTMFDEKRSIGGGEDIRSSVQFKDNGSFEYVLPGNYNSWQNPQLLNKVVTPWCFGIAHWSYTAAELILNDKIKYGNDDAIWEAFTNIRDQKLTGCFTNIANGLEESLLAVPVAAAMEGAASSTTPAPMSLFSYINENTDGLFDPQASAAWTTVSGIDPTDASVDGNYTCQQEKYGSLTADDETNVVAGLDSLYMACDFQQPTTMAEYFNDPMLSKLKILASRRGRKVFMALTRGGTDRYASAGMAGYQDPSVPDPTMHGIPISYCSELDTKALYNLGGTGLATEAAATVTGPRFYMWNGNYAFPVVHPARYLEQDKPLRHPNVPDTYAVPTYVWWNLHCPSRKHQGILSPSTAL